jgi:mRNA-degrading endonuclease RelE of RelBE toxin-antitoxin system
VARLVVTRRALNQIAQLPAELREAVETALDRLAVEPERGTALLGRLRGIWAMRVGNYRILYTIEGRSPTRTIIVRSVRHRAVAYGRRRR